MNIAEDLKKLGEDMAASYDIRVSSIGDIIKDTHSTLKNFHTEHEHMGKEQRTELEHFVNELRKTTKSMLNGFDKEHKEMAFELRKMLSEFMNNFLKAQNQLHNMLASYYKEEIKQPTQKMLSEFRRDFDRAHEAWMSVSRTMAAKKGKRPIAMQKMNRPEQICSILASHPSGMTSGMIAKEMGRSSQSIQTAMSSLKKQGKISKKQNKFFPK